MNVLVVEDDKEMAELLVRGLREEDYEVDLARDGRTALKLSVSGSFDVILLVPGRLPFPSSYAAADSASARTSVACLARASGAAERSIPVIATLA